ncbi:MAG TPA: hypothetical protein VI790_03425 [Candidatus Nanoarchaeia archaeon]|nr:hypothetical protein [Candidatus Nanoarchaeia archaeon]
MSDKNREFTCRCPNCGYVTKSSAPCYVKSCPKCEHPMNEE